MTIKVYLDDYDITEFVGSIPNESQSMGQYGSLVVNAISTIEGIAFTDFWNPSSMSSPFYNNHELELMVLRVYKDNRLTFKGRILNIVNDNEKKTASVNVQSEMNDLIEQGAKYISQDVETPSEAVKNICFFYGIEIDETSFSKATGIYKTDNVEISVNVVVPEIKVAQLLQEIADIGIARIYFVNNKLYYDIERDRSDLALYTFSDKLNNFDGNTILEAPLIETVQKTKFDGYSVEWVDYPRAASGTEGKQGKSISANYESHVRIMNFQAAKWIGEKWYNFSNKLEKKAKVKVPSYIGRELELGYPVEVDYKNIVPYTKDIIEIDKSNNLFTLLTGMTR